MNLHASGHKVIEQGFFSDEGLDFAARIALGRCVRGAGEIGEVLATIARVKNYATWAEQWQVTAEHVAAEADRSRAGGHLVSARSGYLRAATYWACVVDGLTVEEDSDRLGDAFRRHREAWDAFIDCSDGAHLAVAVPYEGTTLPGYLLRPDSSGARRPTLVITNGSDGAVSDMWTSAIAGALERGWNAFVYDGPGQQSMLFERHTYFRPDWEAVLTPVVDALVARDDVDATALTAYGISQAGYWLPRALAFEQRFVAAVADPGVVDVSTSWTGPLGRSMTELLADGARRKFDRNMNLAVKLPGLGRTLRFRGRPYRHEDWYDLFSAVSEYRIDPEIAARITTPLLLTDPEKEQFWPGQSAQLAGMLGDIATLAPFSAEEGAEFHCQPMGRLLTENRMFDWLQDRLATS
ncbi:dipeptidyl aminopeptidase [Nakamurella sp. YIM 132087]|uniref:Dipeptidyl aminopeptidase n=1 Tax=Nakamurella alba TaxID=2665158 RepID=A0A7K1FEW0_9ACTN|nr:dipeptidyl aminopeptidase [Nakamurella alba]MTD12620.1 dipeptidyl aminopeptidase [Nakamurella alba]